MRIENQKISAVKIEALIKNIKISNPKVKIHFRVCCKKQTKTPITLKWIFQIKNISLL
jgi:hypothetical protein